MKIKIEIDEKTLRGLVLDYLSSQLGELALSKDCLTIEVKSKQNYRSEWESAAFRATYERNS